MAQIFQSSIFKSKQGDVIITPIAHASVMISFNDKIIHIDPYSNIADYETLPKADLILFTHHHFDHFDKRAIDKIITGSTQVIGNKDSALEMPRVRAISNGEFITWNGVSIEAVAAYTVSRGWSEGIPYHAKGEGNGYILDFDALRVYVAGDTEFIEDMKNFKKIDVAFLPKMAPYTMTDEEFYEAIKVLTPKVLYPYHYTKIDKDLIRQDFPGIDIK